MRARNPTAFLGAAFLMATSAIGPGFLTQTTLFTAQLGASFGFAILLSVLLDLGAQVNIWRVVTGSGQSAPELANGLLPGLGHALTALVVLGGLAFNIANVAGAGLGLEACTGLPAPWGAALSAALAAAIFLRPTANVALDWFARALGLLMILLTAWVALAARPPLGEALWRSVWPERVDATAIVTIVGGTVGGYISFAGAHRLLEAGLHGPEAPALATRSAFMGIGVATLMRLLLFLAAFGVLRGGAVLDPANPPAAMFRLAAGDLGHRFFGLVMWSAAITSVLGCAFTAMSFLVGSLPGLRRHRGALTLGFILFSLLVFLGVGKPVQLLVWAGTLNGFILPLALAAMLLAARRLPPGVLPWPWRVLGWSVVLVMGGMALKLML